MPRGRNRTLQDIQTFIRKRLPAKLRRDLEGLRIVKEADVECAAYHHLRRYTGEDPRWRVLARKHVPITGHYVDLLMFKNYKPAIALELKWGRPEISNKDRRSLLGALKKLGVNKAYLLSAVSSDNRDEPLLKERLEGNVFHQIVVRVGFTGPRLEEWKRRRRLFRSEMAIGRGRQVVHRDAT